MPEYVSQVEMARMLRETGYDSPGPVDGARAIGIEAEINSYLRSGQDLRDARTVFELPG